MLEELSDRPCQGGARGAPLILMACTCKSSLKNFLATTLSWTLHNEHESRHYPSFPCLFKDYHFAQDLSKLVSEFVVLMSLSSSTAESQ
jgi:hypothetical protein